MLRWEAALAVVLVVSAAPVAVAAGPPACEEVTEENAVPLEGRYLRVDADHADLEIWEEDNGVDGLQAEACTSGDGEEVDADEHAFTLPPGIPEPPSWLEDPCAELISHIVPGWNVTCPVFP